MWLKDLRVKAMQRLAKVPDRATYLALQQEIAQQLKMSERNVRYLIRGWESAGVAGVIRQGRSDCGKPVLDKLREGA